MQECLKIVEASSFKENYKTREVAFNYGVQVKTIEMHKSNHADELIENIHYFYSLEQTKGGKQRALRWTLEGVYMLGFFIKSKQAKIYRKKVAEFLRLCDEARQKKFNEARATITEQTDEIANLEATVYGITKRFTSQINGYKWQAAVQKKENKALLDKLTKFEKFMPPSDDFPTYAELFERYARIYRAKKELENSKETYTQKNENAVLMLNDINKDLATAYRKIGAAMSYLGDVFGNEHFIKDKFKK